MQELAAVQILLNTASTGTDSAERAQAIAQAHDCVGHQIVALRRLIGHLRPLALDTLGLVPALEELARRSSRPDLAIEVSSQPVLRLSTEAETAAYRIVQEAVTNAVRHAGAGRIMIEARSAPDDLQITVRDNGANGPHDDEFRAGFGVLGMRERAEAIGATLSFTSDDGLVMCLTIPECPDGRRISLPGCFPRLLWQCETRR